MTMLQPYLWQQFGNSKCSNHSSKYVIQKQKNRSTIGSSYSYFLLSIILTIFIGVFHLRYVDLQFFFFLLMAYYHWPWTCVFILCKCCNRLLDKFTKYFCVYLVYIIWNFFYIFLERVFIWHCLLIFFPPK